jgi:hypothetical protein
MREEKGAFGGVVRAAYGKRVLLYFQPPERYAVKFFSNARIPRGCVTEASCGITTCALKQFSKYPA